jgi:hypothetical protein
MRKMSVARAEEQSPRATPHNVAQQVPPARPDVLLLHGAGMDRGPGVSEIERRVENALQIRGHLGRVVERATELHCAWNPVRHRLAHGLQNLDCPLGLRQPVPAAGLGLDLLDRAGEVDVESLECQIGNRESGVGIRVKATVWRFHPSSDSRFLIPEVLIDFVDRLLAGIIT